MTRSLVWLSLLVVASTLLTLPSLHGRRDTTIFDELPPHMRVLVDWGQRRSGPSMESGFIFFPARIRTSSGSR